MRRRCREIDKQVAHYRTLIARVIDKQTRERLEHLVEKLEAEKKALHPDPAR